VTPCLFQELTFSGGSCSFANPLLFLFDFFYCMAMAIDVIIYSFLSSLVVEVPSSSRHFQTLPSLQDRGPPSLLPEHVLRLIFSLRSHHIPLPAVYLSALPVRLDLAHTAPLFRKAQFFFQCSKNPPPRCMSLPAPPFFCGIFLCLIFEHSFLFSPLHFAGDKPSWLLEEVDDLFMRFWCFFQSLEPPPPY